MNDTISAQGTITIDAGTTLGSEAVAVVGNLTTNNQAIHITADGNAILGGEINAGTGAVTITSNTGMIVHNTALPLNIVAGSVTLNATTPSAYNLDLTRDEAIATSTAAQAEAAAERTSADSFNAALAVTTVEAAQAWSNYNADTPIVNAVQDLFNTDNNTATALFITASVLTGVGVVMTLVKDAATIPESVCRAFR